MPTQDQLTFELLNSIEAAINQVIDKMIAEDPSLTETIKKLVFATMDVHKVKRIIFER